MPYFTLNWLFWFFLPNLPKINIFESTLAQCYHVRSILLNCTMPFYDFKCFMMEATVHFQNMDLADDIMVRNLPNTDEKMTKEPFVRVLQNDARTIWVRIEGECFPWGQLSKNPKICTSLKILQNLQENTCPKPLLHKVAAVPLRGKVYVCEENFSKEDIKLTIKFFYMFLKRMSNPLNIILNGFYLIKTASWRCGTLIKNHLLHR